MKQSIVVRALQLAASGSFKSVAAIKVRLKHEGYIIAAISQELGGLGMTRELKKLYKAALQNPDIGRLEHSRGPSKRRSLTYDIRDLVQDARDRGDVVDVSAFAAKLGELYPFKDRDEIAALIMQQAGAAGVEATWVSEHKKRPNT